MALYAVAGTGPANVDLTGLGKGKRIASWQFSCTTAAATINLRNGSAAGTPFIQIKLAIGASASQPYIRGAEPVFPAGVFVEIVSGGPVVGSVDLV